MTQTSEAPVARNPESLKAVRIVAGAASGAVSFFLLSFLSFWSIRGGESLAPVVLLILGIIVLVAISKTQRSYQLAFASTMAIVLLLGYLVGGDGRVAGSLSVDPGTLLLYGGHSAAVAVFAGAIVGVVMAAAWGTHRLNTHG